MPIEFEPIGTFHTDATDIPRHWSVSDITGRIIIDEIYAKGLKDIQAGQTIIVLFHFHKSAKFDPNKLVQTPPHRHQAMGVFSICSPYRPNPIGLSVLEVIDIDKNVISVRRADMIDGTPILDIKPHIEDKHDCPSYRDA
jgi:tRNA-Thr(GGU) m(6)t(6)A37 methyltransferase TsaA